MNSWELLLVFAVTAGVTFFVILLSVGLVIYKVASTAHAALRGKLYALYSNAASEFLLAELPATLFKGKPSNLFAAYESLLEPLKKDLSFAGRFYRTTKWDTLKSVLLDYSQDVTGEARERLTYAFYSLGFADEAIRRIGEKQWWVRARAAKQLGQYRVRRGMFVLTVALDDSRDEVRSQAVQSLISLAGPQALRTIFLHIKRISRWLAIELSAEVMRYGPESVPYLLEALDVPEPSVVEFAVEMLAEVGFVDAVEPIRKIARAYPSLSVRLKAIEALGRLGDTRAELLLLQLTLDPDRQIRLKSMEALARTGSPGAADFLLERIADGDVEEKICAASAIERMGEKGKRILEDMRRSAEPLLGAVADHVQDLSASGAQP